ncbi:MAG: hypothetical protein ABI172_08490 [Ginsengibacter sp.]
MKKLKYVISFLFVTAIISGCSKTKNDDISFVKTATAPSDESTKFVIAQDNSGMVTITPNGAGAVSYDVYFGDTTKAPVNVIASKSVVHQYAEGSYTVKMVAKGMTGQTTETSSPLVVTFIAPVNVKPVVTQNIHNVTVSATALYATGGFQVYYGDVPNEVPAPFASGANVSHNYAQAGNYTVKVIALSGGAATTTVNTPITVYDSLLLPMTFENPHVSYNWGDFGGNSTTVIPNPFPSGINTSATVAKMVKSGQSWAGNYIVLDAPLDLSVKHVFKVKIYSPRVGMKIWFQLERSGNNSFQDHREVATTVANQWEEMTFDFSGVDNSKRLQNMLFFIDNGTVGDGSPNYTMYFDDITLN